MIIGKEAVKAIETFGYVRVSARAREVRFGPPVKELPDDFEELYQAWQGGGIPLEALLERCHMRRSTFYKRLREYRQSGQNAENRIAVPNETQSG